MNILNHFMTGALAMMAITLFPGCSNEEKQTLDGVADAKAPLNISVSNSLITKVGGGNFWGSIP